MQKKLAKFLQKKDFFPFLLVIVTAISHLQWFNPWATLFHGDWSLWPEGAVLGLWADWGTWVPYFDFGTPNIQLAFIIFKLPWSLAVGTGLGVTNAYQLTLLIPIALLGFLSPYYLFRKYSGDRLIAFCVALFYGSTTFFLVRQTGHLPIAFVYALAPLVLQIFDKALEKRQLNYWLLFLFTYYLSALYELRITLILTAVLALYLFVAKFSDLRRNLKYIATIAPLFVGLNMFWLLPVKFGGFSSAISAVADRGLFGNKLFDLQHAITLSESAWTGGRPNEFFVMQPVKLYLWVVPFIVIMPLVILSLKRFANYRLYLVGLITSLIGILLTKQSSEPLAFLYQWMYENVPAFNLYREASKFYLVTAIGYAFALAAALMIFKNNLKNQRIYKIAGSAIIVVSFLNLAPLITGNYGTLMESRSMPNDYAVYEKHWQANQQSGDRTLLVPGGVNWTPYTYDKPRAGLVSSLSTAWNQGIVP